MGSLDKPLPQVVYMGTCSLPPAKAEAYRLQAVFSEGLGGLLREEPSLDDHERAWGSWAYHSLTHPTNFPDEFRVPDPFSVQYQSKMPFSWAINAMWLTAFSEGREHVAFGSARSNVELISSAARKHYTLMEETEAPRTTLAKDTKHAA